MNSQNINQAKIFCVAGTRPEYIKVFPLYQELKKQLKKVYWVKSGQHQTMVDSLEKFFDIKPDFELKLKQREPNTDAYLGKLAADILEKSSELFCKEKPDLVIVQGDTMTAMQVALAAFYQGIKIVHLEAGLRTFDIQSPFPEELSRRLISQIASINFAPSILELEELEKEKKLFKLESKNFNSGNTVIDSLENCCAKIGEPGFDWSYWGQAQLAFSAEDFNLEAFLEIHQNHKIILLSSHRYENQKENLVNLKEAIQELADELTDLVFVFSLHKNPAIQSVFAPVKHEKILFFETINYPLFVLLMQSSYLVFTDSGGLQEEAPHLGKPVLVFREHTERKQGIEQGHASLSGLDKASIKNSIRSLVENPQLYQSMQQDAKELYGDGQAAKRIVDVLKLVLKEQ